MVRRPSNLFRIAGLIACATVTLPALISVPGRGYADVAAWLPAGKVQLVPWILAGIVVVFLALASLFAFLFWQAIGEFGAPGNKKIKLLLGQTAIALFIPELQYLVAAEAGYMLTFRTGIILVLTQFSVITVSILALGEPLIAGQPASSALLASEVGSVFAWQSFAFCIGHIASSESHSRQELARVNAELRATQEMLSASSRMAERMRISRELHDSLGHNLTGLTLNLQLAGHLATGAVAEPVRQAHLVSRLLLNDVRDAVSELRETSALDLRQALTILSSGVFRPVVHLDVDQAASVSDPSQAHALFRCAQEALTNAVRHSRAKNLWLRLRLLPDGVEFHAADDGGGSPSLAPGNGLRGMKERVEELGGRIEIEPMADKGFSLRIWMPGVAV